MKFNSLHLYKVHHACARSPPRSVKSLGHQSLDLDGYYR